MNKTSAFITSALAIATLTIAPSAHADNDSYLAELSADGVPITPPWSTTNSVIRGAYYACSQLRGGMPFDVLAGSIGFPFNPDQGAQIVTAAQHNICPDTLGR
jgi:hypothetical protein